MFDDNEHFRLFGTLSREETGRRLAAGPLEATLQDGNLRRLRYHGHEALRAVAFLVRDRDWGTLKPVISDLAVEENADRFRVAYRALFRAPDGARLTADLRIDGSAIGRLEFSARYRADSDFETARAGFTVLHPLTGVVGQPVEIVHGDGASESARWPDLIDPWQPFKDIRAITHAVAPGIRAKTLFAGDIFEMEDQRNWTDASFKTYGRPLALPWPYAIPAGAPQEQSVRLELSHDGPVRPAARPVGRLRLGREVAGVALPRIGVGLRPEGRQSDLAAVEALRKVGAHLLSGHFDPAAGHGEDALEGFAQMQRASGLPFALELALPCRGAPGEELREIAGSCARAGLALESLFVCPAVDRQSTPPGSRWPDCPPLGEVYAAARAAFPSVPLGGGMMSYFTELNRKRAPGRLIDYVGHTTTPIVHAADDLSVMQSFEALADVIRSVRAIYPEKSYRIGPSTIAMRQNPYGSATKDKPALVRVPMASVDPRHNGDFGAAWTLAYAAVVASARLDVLMLSTLTGPFGLIAGDGEPAPAGSLRPLGRVLAELASAAGSTLWRLRCSEPGVVFGIGAGDRTLIANVTPEVAVVEPDWPCAAARSLTRERALSMSAGLSLLPYESVVVS